MELSIHALFEGDSLNKDILKIIFALWFLIPSTAENFNKLTYLVIRFILRRIELLGILKFATF